MNQTLARAASREELLHEACRIVTEQAGFSAACVGWPDPETHRVVPVVCTGAGSHFLDDIEVFADDRPEGRGPVGTCIREGRPSVFNDFLKHPLPAAWYAAAEAHAIRAVAALPIPAPDRNVGALVVYASEPHAFRDEEMSLFEDVAAGISLALERLEQAAERHRVEEALCAANRDAEASRAQYEQVVSMISDITWRYEVDARGNFVAGYVSPVADRLLGLPAGAIGNDTEKYFSYVPAEDLPAVHAAFSSGLKTLAKDAACEYRLRKADGTILWVRTKGSAYLQPDGHVVAFGSTSDITERKHAEEAVLESRAKLEAALASMAEAVFISDTEARFIDFNEAFATFHRFKNKEECARTLAEYPSIMDVFLPNGEPAPVDQWAVPRARAGKSPPTPSTPCDAKTPAKLGSEVTTSLPSATRTAKSSAPWWELAM